MQFDIDQIEVTTSEQAEVLKACQYLVWREQENRTETWIAEEWKVSRMTLYNWRVKWEETGVLGKARTLLLNAQEAYVIAAQTRVLMEVPEMLAKMISIAKSAKSEFASIEAIAWLWKEIVKPALDQVEGDDEAERAYANSKLSDPSIIEAPAYITKRGKRSRTKVGTQSS